MARARRRRGAPAAATIYSWTAILWAEGVGVEGQAAGRRVVTELERRFPRCVAALDAIVAFVAEFFTASGMSGEDPSTVELMIEEIFTNMVKYSREGTQDVAIRLRRRGESVEIRLVDFDVEPFDYSQAPAVDTPELLAQRRSGGLGLHLVQRIADRVTYEYVDRNNLVTIEKRLGGAHARHPGE